MNSYFSFRLLWKYRRRQTVRSLSYLIGFYLCWTVIYYVAQYNDMNIYVTKKYVIRDNPDKPKFVIDFTYNGRQYESIGLKRDQWDAIKLNQNNNIRLRYAVYEKYAIFLFLIVGCAIPILIPWVVISIVELRNCIQYVHELTFIEKQKQLDSF